MGNVPDTIVINPKSQMIDTLKKFINGVHHSPNYAFSSKANFILNLNTRKLVIYNIVIEYEDLEMTLMKFLENDMYIEILDSKFCQQQRLSKYHSKVKIGKNE